MRFNTSHVVVYRKVQIILCCGDIVSIHLMLQFITRLTYSPFFKKLVSIHLMLQFISGHYFFCLVWYLVSIHLMLQFIMKPKGKLIVSDKFQYISCCSLSKKEIRKCKTIIVSIHLMLQFIMSNKGNRILGRVFQYISCCSLSNFIPNRL